MFSLPGEWIFLCLPNIYPINKLVEHRSIKRLTFCGLPYDADEGFQILK